jgi:hypothetical protein
MDQLMDPITPNPFIAEDMKTSKIPSEAMHEMLGSLYIWTKKMKPEGLNELKDRSKHTSHACRSLIQID